MTAAVVIVTAARAAAVRAARRAALFSQGGAEARSFFDSMEPRGFYPGAFFYRRWSITALEPR